MKYSYLRYILIWSLFIICRSGFAVEDVATDIPTRFSRIGLAYTVNPDGTKTMDWHGEVKILKEQAIAQWKVMETSYSKSMQKLEVTNAYTLKASGQRIDVPKTNFQFQENGGKDTVAPALSDRSTIKIIFPEVEVGDTIVLSTKLIDIEPVFANHFYLTDFFPKTIAYDDVHLKVDIPSNMWVQYQTVDMQEIRNEEKEGRKIFEWRYKHEHVPLSKNKRTDYSVYDVEKEPGLMLTTFKNYADIAKAYGERSHSKAIVTERIQKLADSLTQDKKTPRDIARALYEWIAVNIDYTSNDVGVGTVVPRDLEFVLDNRTGDCKDNATLLQALLAAKGIDSIQVLINSTNLYHLPKIPTPYAVNHIINYIPSLDLYLDSTSNHTPFGMLPYAIQDKPALWVEGYQVGRKTPMSSWDATQSMAKTDVTIQPNGTIKGTVVTLLKGEFAAEQRAYFRTMLKDDEAQLIANFFRDQGYTATGTINKEDPKNLLDTYQYQAQFQIEHALPVPGPNGLLIYPLFLSAAPINYIVAKNSQIHEADMPFDYACLSATSIEEYTYRFPMGTRIFSIPKDVSYTTEAGFYKASYTKKGNVVYVKRVLSGRHAGRVCPAKMRAEVRSSMGKILSDVKAQIVYEIRKR